MSSANNTSARIVIDANIVFRWAIHNQPLHLESSLLLADCAEQGILLFVPPIFQSELDSAVRRSVHLGLLTEEDGEQAFELLDELPVISPSHVSIHRRAREIAKELAQPRVYDASYAALAEFLGCSFWTGDKKFYNAAHEKYPFVHLIETYKAGKVSSVLVSEYRPPLDAGLSNEALAIALNQPVYWEPKLFAQVLREHLDSHASIRAEHRNGICSGPSEHLDEDDWLKWLSPYLEQQGDYVLAAERIINTLGPEAFGTGGREHKVETMIVVARELAVIYADLIEWSQRFRRLDLPQMYQPFLAECAKFSDNAIESIESLPEHLLSGLAEVEAMGDDVPEGTRPSISLDVDFNPRNSEAFHREHHILLQKYAAQRGLVLEDDDPLDS